MKLLWNNGSIKILDVINLDHLRATINIERVQLTRTAVNEQDLNF